MPGPDRRKAIREPAPQRPALTPRPRPSFVSPGLAARIDQAKATGKCCTFHCAEWDEVGELAAIYCKGCGRKIKGERLHGNPERQKLDDPGMRQRTVLLLQRVVVGPLPGYTEVVIEMEDGDRHETHICEGCLTKLDDPEALAAFYLADLETMAEEFARGGGDGSRHGRYLDFLGQKKPVRWRRKVPVD